MGVKSKFLKSSLGEPASLTILNVKEIGAPNKHQELLNSPARASCVEYTLFPLGIYPPYFFFMTMSISSLKTGLTPFLALTLIFYY